MSSVSNDITLRMRGDQYFQPNFMLPGQHNVDKRQLDADHKVVEQ